MVRNFVGRHVDDLATRNRVEAFSDRRAEGCETVEMECAAFAACATFRGARFGQILYSADTLAGVFFAVLNGSIPKLSELGVKAPPSLQRVLDRLLSRDAQARYLREDELLADLCAIGRQLDRELRVAVPR